MRWTAALMPPVMAIGCKTTSPSRVNVNPGYAGTQVRRVPILPFEGVPVEKEVEEFKDW